MTDNTERAQVGWGFGLRWVLASTVGLAVGGAVGFAVVDAVPEAVGFTVSVAVSWAVAGASMGTAQWLVLRRHIPGAGWWVLASTVGLAVGFAVALAVSEAVGLTVGLTGGSHFSSEPVALVLFGAVAGASMGTAQWLVLRRQVSQTGWWVLASIVGVALSVAVFFTVTAGVEEAAGVAGGGALSGAVYGAITGGVLVWLLRQPVAKDLDLSQAAE